MQLIDNKYVMDGGINPLDLCAQYGTPLYVYEAGIMKRQYKLQRLCNAFSYPQTRFHFACKALTNINVMKLFRTWGAGLDCVSIEEVLMGIKAGFKREDILFTPNFASVLRI